MYSHIILYYDNLWANLPKKNNLSLWNRYYSQWLHYINLELFTISEAS